MLEHNKEIKKYLTEISDETYNSLMKEVNSERRLNKEKIITERINKIKNEVNNLLEEFPGLEFRNYIECEDCDYETTIYLEDFLENMVCDF